MNTNKVRNLLQELDRQAAMAPGGVGSFENADYEQVRHLAERMGYPVATAARIAANAASRPGVAAQLKAAVGGAGFIPELPGVSGTPGNINTAAQFTLSVVRDTIAISEDLPFVLFGGLDVANGYREVLSGQLAAGTVLTSVEIGESVGQPNAAVFTYTKGASVDTITVTCDSAPYPTVLQSTLTTLMQVNKARISLSDPSQVGQFNHSFDGITKNLFGKQEFNPLSPSNFRSPQQQQQGIVDLDVNFKIDQQSMFRSKILPVAGLKVNYAFFVDRFYLQNSRNW